MQETYPLSLALFDFVPVVFFLVGAYFLVRLVGRLCSEYNKRLTMIGSSLIFVGGFLTAIWKLLYTIGVGDYQLLRNFQFAFAAPGFVLLFIAVLRLASAESEEKEARYVSMLMMAIWKIPLLIVMTLASMGMQSILAFIAARFNAKVASVGFIVAFLCLVSMGAMASGEQTLARQWVEQSVNTVGQLGFMLGCILLYQKTAFVY